MKRLLSMILVLIMVFSLIPNQVYASSVQEQSGTELTFLEGDFTVQEETTSQGETAAEEEITSQEETAAEEEITSQEETAAEEEVASQEETAAEEEITFQEETVAEEEITSQEETAAEEEIISQEETPVVETVFSEEIPVEEEKSTIRICEEGCILETEEEHLENDGECFVWINCTKTDGCEGPDNHEGECYGSALYAGDAAISVSGNYRNIYVVVNDALYYINSNGSIENTDGTAATFTPGTYTIYYGPYGGRGGGNNKTVYKGTVVVEDGDQTVTVGLSSVTYSRQSTADQYKYAESIYWNTTSFNHIHVRVAGSYVIKIDGTEHTATVSNPSMIVNVNGVQQIKHTWTNTETYEWTYSAQVSRSSHIEVILTLDLTYQDSSGQTIILEDVTVTYDNVNNVDKFIEAIAICDGVEGLDFTVSVEDLTKDLQYYKVIYQWRVYNLDGSVSTDLPESVGSNGLPASVSDITEGTEYVYNTGYIQGTSYYDYESGLLYTFHGWDTYSHSSVFNVDPTAAGYYELDDEDANPDNNKTIPITADTWINGYWTVSELDPAAAYLMVKKVVAVENGDESYVTDYLQNTGKMYISIDPGIDQNGDDASLVDVDYPAVITENGYRIDVYQYETPFVFHEYQADVPGYTRNTVISTSGTNLSLVTEDGITVQGTTAAVVIEEEYDPAQSPYNLGTVIYTNTYTKNTGDPVAVYPTLSLLKSAADTHLFQQGVTFAMYRDSACTDKVADYTTNESGISYISFDGLDAGTYYLKETKALDGYKLDTYVYEITLTVSETKEELHWNETTQQYEYVQVSYYTISVAIPDGSTAVYSATGTTDIYYRLHIYNEPILGSLQVNKTITGMDDGDKGSLDAVIIVHGPIQRDDSGTITDIGATWQLNVNENTDWKASLKELSLGEYLIHESFASVHGYTWTGVTYENLETVVYNNITSGIFHIEDETAVNLVIANTYEEWTAADFWIKKMDDENKALSGAVFQLYTDEDCTIPTTGTFATSVTTGADGYAHFTGYTVPAGQESVIYYLKETKAPVGYYLNDQIYKVVISAVTENGVTAYEPSISLITGGDAGFDSSVDLLKVTNYPILGKLTITKAFTDGLIPVDVDGKFLLTELSIEVNGPDGYTQIKTLNADNNWSITLEDIPLGTYNITEFDANVPGYSWSVDYSSENVTVTESNLSPAVTVTNTYTRNQEFYEVPTTLAVKKVDEDGTTPLAGAVFSLVAEDGSYQESFTTGEEGIVVFNMLSGILVENLPMDREYILTETKAPDGYERIDTKWVVTVTEDGNGARIELNESKNIFEGFWDWIIGKDSNIPYEDGVLTVTNQKKLGDLTITKQVSDKEEMYTDAVYSFILDCSDDDFDQTFTLKANESITVKDIPWGTTYTLTEDVTGAAYTSAIEDEGEGRIWAEKTNIVVTNTYAYTRHNEPLSLVKVDDEDNSKVIAGAGFTLYTDKELKNAVGKEVFSDEYGKLALPIEAEGTYYLAETTTPDGYHSNSSVYVVTAEEKIVVKNKGTVEALTEIQMHIRIEGLTGTSENQIDYTYMIENTAIKPVVVNVEKIWEDGGYYNRPAEVEVTLYRDGTEYETIPLNEKNNWRYTWENLTDEYDWTVDETVVPAEYSKTVESNGYDWKITNTRNPKPVEITITKAWVHNGGKELPASIDGILYRDGEVYEQVTLSSDNAWTYTWKDLTDVSVWSVDEANVPAGYTKAITIDGYKFTITNTRIVKPVEVSVNKIWHGVNVEHPTSIKVTLYRDGAAYDTVTLSVANNWSYRWTNLTDEYDWSVDEPSVPGGYNKTIHRNGNNFTIINTHKDIPKTGDFTNIFGMGTMAFASLIGLGLTAKELIISRKKEEDE